MERGPTRTVGAVAEQFAFQYLLKRGLQPIARNFRTRRGEIDLIMRDKTCLAFIEVRYRRNSSFVAALYTVNERKQHKLATAAAQFLARHPALQHERCRFDVVGVDCDSREAVSVRWLKNAFRPGG
ncbi:MAG TPA: YraN family protein [Woeseiaceae bacterium]|nr:YraN family protein [Woeseiaceae bacterium]